MSLIILTPNLFYTFMLIYLPAAWGFGFLTPSLLIFASHFFFFLYSLSLLNQKYLLRLLDSSNYKICLLEKESPSGKTHSLWVHGQKWYSIMSVAWVWVTGAKCASLMILAISLTTLSLNYFICEMEKISIIVKYYVIYVCIYVCVYIYVYLNIHIFEYSIL